MKESAISWIYVLILIKYIFLASLQVLDQICVNFQGTKRLDMFQ